MTNYKKLKNFANNTMQTKSNIKTLEEFKEEHYGKRGTPKRDKLDKGFEAFKLGAMLHEARLKKG